MAAVGVLRQAPVQFDCAADVPLGGVLWALPALLAEGLLRHSRKLFQLPAGFYPLETIFLVVAFMELERLRSLEELRYEQPGEWGRLLGLDRIPEVRTLREKLSHLCQPPGVAVTWSSDLAREWMAAQPDHDGVYYADGHVRVYHGKLAQPSERVASGLVNSPDSPFPHEGRPWADIRFWPFSHLLTWIKSFPATGCMVDPWNNYQP